MIPAGDERTPDGGESFGDADHEQLLRLRVLDHPDAYLLAVSGSVDGLTAARLREGIERGFAERAGRPVVVDMTGVDFFDSAGLRALSASGAEAGRQPGFEPLRVVVDHNRPVIRPMELVGLDDVLSLYYDVPSATAGDSQLGQR